MGNGGFDCLRIDCPGQGNILGRFADPSGFGFVVQRSSCFIATSVGSGGLTLNRVVIAVAASNGERLLSSIINIGAGCFGLLDDLCRNRKIIGIGGLSVIGYRNRIPIVRSDGKLIACFRLSCVSSQLFCLAAGIGGLDDHAGQIQRFTAVIVQFRLRRNFDFRQRICRNIDRNITGVRDTFILVRSSYSILTALQSTFRKGNRNIICNRTAFIILVDERCSDIPCNFIYRGRGINFPCTR